MCGRFVISSPQEVIEEVFGAPIDGRWDARFNVAPGQDIPVILNGSRGRSLRAMLWGFTPRWAKAKRGPRGGVRLPTFINARSETLEGKASFREAFSQRRCLIPANAFYEWQQRESGKLPHVIGFGEHAPFAMAGIWETWVSPDEGPREGVCVVTTRANQEMRSLHERMPVLIHPDHFDLWLGAESPPALLRGLMEPIPSGFLQFYPVGDEVNRADAGGPGLVDPR